MDATSSTGERAATAPADAMQFAAAATGGIDIGGVATGSVLDGFLDLVVRLAGAAAGAIRVVTPEGDLRLASSVGLSAEMRIRDAVKPASCGICGAAIRDDDTRRATRAIGCNLRDSEPACGGRISCALAVPLDYQGRAIGVLNLFFPPETDPPDCVSQLLRPFGQLLGMALENDRLTRENLQARVLAERQAMAAEIHDAVAQSLTFARMRMAMLESELADGNTAARTYCTDVNGELRYAHGRLREVITHFRAGMDARGLVASLREAVANFVDRSGIALEFTPPIDEPDLTAEQARQVFGIVQEALANVRKHARASRARLTVQPCNDAFEIVVEDDGCGLGAQRPARVTADDDHYGITIMHERAERAGGCLRIDSPVSGGTRVRLLVPAAHRMEES